MFSHIRKNPDAIITALAGHKYNNRLKASELYTDAYRTRTAEQRAKIRRTAKFVGAVAVEFKEKGVGRGTTEIAFRTPDTKSRRECLRMIVVRRRSLILAFGCKPILYKSSVRISDDHGVYSTNAASFYSFTIPDAYTPTALVNSDGEPGELLGMVLRRAVDNVNRRNRTADDAVAESMRFFERSEGVEFTDDPYDILKLLLAREDFIKAVSRVMGGYVDIYRKEANGAVLWGVRLGRNGRVDPFTGEPLLDEWVDDLAAGEAVTKIRFWVWRARQDKTDLRLPPSSTMAQLLALYTFGREE